VTVKQQTSEEMALKALRLMREIGATREMMEKVLGVNGLPLLEQQLDGQAFTESVTIEGEVLEAEIDDGDDED